MAFFLLATTVRGLPSDLKQSDVCHLGVHSQPAERMFEPTTLELQRGSGGLTVRPEAAKLAETLGATMRKARRAQGLTQKSAARKLGIARSTLANIERGGEVGTKFRGRLSDVYPVESAELLALAEEFDRLNAAGTADRADLAPAVDVPTVFRHKRSVHARLAGRWFAIWETTVDGEVNINTEELELEWKGTVLAVTNTAPSPENPHGGYVWAARLELFDNAHLLGTYVAVDPAIRSKGTLFLSLHSSGAFMYGRWVGCSYDSPVATGSAVWARDADRLHALLSRHCRVQGSDTEGGKT